MLKLTLAAYSFLHSKVFLYECLEVCKDLKMIAEWTISCTSCSLMALRLYSFLC